MGACRVLRYMEGALVLALPTLPCLSLKIGNVEIALFEKEILIFSASTSHKVTEKICKYRIQFKQ